MVEKKEMPLPSYTNFGPHPGANLSDAQRESIIEWAKVQMAHLKDSYPADSWLISKLNDARPKS